MELLIKETLEMYCPICEKEHEIHIVIENEIFCVNKSCVEVENEKYFCGEENECFMDGEMIDKNLAKIREMLKENGKVYRLTIWSHYEEDDGEPYTIDYSSMSDALNAKEQYENELTLSGQHAYSVCGPDVMQNEI